MDRQKVGDPPPREKTVDTEHPDVPRRSQSLPTHFPNDFTPVVTSVEYPIRHRQGDLYPISDEDVVIVVMGPTGSGKSSFINVATRQTNTLVGHSLSSCTKEIQLVVCRHPNNRCNVVFVDTQGFDDTHIKDTDVLQDISHWLTTTYRRNIMLKGLLYLHRISDNRMAGTPLRLLMMFKDMCGMDALQNVILTTTMWNQVDPPTGSLREKDLQTTYWDPMLRNGSRMARFDYTFESAWKIISMFQGPPIPLQIQEEMVDQGKLLGQTAAANTVSILLEKLLAFYIEKIRKLKARLQKPNTHEATAKIIQEHHAATQKLNNATQQKEKLDNLPKKPLHRSISTAFKRVLSVRPRPSSPNPAVGSGVPPPPVPNPPEPVLAFTEQPPASSSWLPPDGDRYQRLYIPEHRGRGLAVTICALKHVLGIANMPCLPILKGGVELMLTIAESIEAMNRTEHSLITLTHNAGWLLVAIAEQINRGEISDDMRQTVESLVEDLKDVQHIIQEMATHGIASRYTFQRADENIVAMCSNKIQLALQRFELRSTIRMDQAIIRLENLFGMSMPDRMPAFSRSVRMDRD